ncbi:hypothetical protein Stube_07050 [Streptomyces tubercidicus]|uniref:Uncharacterized protein n=1 Tax=Streptomyces tubercidicus TaxID=47759 RepID=A0A640UL70_9ACTN|nr:hypothetical protein Stube_07050 [Streptomyces tubercidicus]
MKDPDRSEEWKIENSPFCTIRRQVGYEVAVYGYNRVSSRSLPPPLSNLSSPRPRTSTGRPAKGCPRSTPQRTWGRRRVSVAGLIAMRSGSLTRLRHRVLRHSGRKGERHSLSEQDCIGLSGCCGRRLVGSAGARRPVVQARCSGAGQAGDRRLLGQATPNLATL